MVWRALRLFLVAILSILTGCDPSPSSRDAAEPAPEKTIHFQVRGVLQKLSPNRRHAVIAHDDIGDYMKAMTMEFELADPAEASALQPGDILNFRLSVTDTRSWIDQIQKTGRTELPPNRAEQAAATPAPSRQLPDVALLDQRGQPFGLSELRGRSVAITFLFTRCPLPNFCPLMSRNFAIVQKELATTAPPEKWRLLCITIDPEHDTPEALANYAKSYGADPKTWIFATGSEADIRQVAAVFGMEFANTNGQINHNLRTAVIGPDGKIQKVFEGNDWQPADVVAEMRRVIAAAP